MRNKVSCVAQKLSQLDPPMIQSVVEPDAFSIGRQYAIEHRAQILGADDTSLNSSVIGTHGLYAQSLRLKGGSLVTKCSCPLTEQPFCRHCVAALLAYYYRSHRQDIIDTPPDGKTGPKPVVIEPIDEPEVQADPRPEAAAQAPHQSSLELGLRDVTVFIEWMQPAIAAMERRASLPAMPDRPSGQVRRWIEAVQTLDETRRLSEAQCLAQASDLKAHEAEVGRLTRELETATRTAKEAQAMGEDLRRELDQARGSVSRLSRIEQEHRALEGRMQNLLGELRKKSGETERLAATLKELSESLKALGPS